MDPHQPCILQEQFPNLPPAHVKPLRHVPSLVMAEGLTPLEINVSERSINWGCGRRYIPGPELKSILQIPGLQDQISSAHSVFNAIVSLSSSTHWLSHVICFIMMSGRSRGTRPFSTMISEISLRPNIPTEFVHGPGLLGPQVGTSDFCAESYWRQYTHVINRDTRN